jgi:hypothetical protein
MTSHSFGRRLANVSHIAIIELTLSVTEKIACIFCASHSGYGIGSRAGAAGFRAGGVATCSEAVLAGEGRLTGRAAGGLGVEEADAAAWELEFEAWEGNLVWRSRDEADGPGCG